MSWSPEQYLKFEQERNTPITDLLNRIPLTGVNHAIDLGCGPGNSTALLAGKYPQAGISGIDSSAEMIAAAKARLPNLSFTVSDVTSWEPENKFDVILANAVFQWVPDHEKLFPKLMNHLNPNGALAVQMPDNLEEPAQLLMRKVAAEGPWAVKLKNAEKRTPRHNADWYYDVLSGLTSDLNIWRTTYYHPLNGLNGIVEWFKGSGLRPFLDPLNEEEKAGFEKQYLMELAEVFTLTRDGKVLLPFPRLFVVAVK